MKILVERDSELHTLFRRCLLVKNEIHFRQKSRDKQKDKLDELLTQCHAIVKKTIAKELGWEYWNICVDGTITDDDLRRGKVSIYVEEVS